MTSERNKRFTRVDPVTDAEPDAVHPAPTPSARQNFLDAVEEITHALALATPPGAGGITRRSHEYYAANMAIIRTAALFEEDSFVPFLRSVPTSQRRAIATMRNIAAHAGYRQMDDTVLWETLTSDLPRLLSSLRTAAEPERDSPQ